MTGPAFRRSPAERSRRPVLALGTALMLGLTGCGLNSDPLATGGGASTPDGSVTVGSADFPESQIIAEIYAGALRSEGIEADTEPGIGAREAYIGALQDGSIDAVPDYTGNLLTYFDPEATATGEEEILQELPEAMPPGLSVLEPSPAQNKDSIVVTRQTADEHGLRSLEDLAPLCADMTFAGAPEFQERSYGLDGLASVYGCEPASFQPINDAGGPLTVDALTSGDADAADIFTTTPAIVEEDLVVLEDPRSNFAAQQVIPLVSPQRLPDGAEEVLDGVSEKLSTEDLLELNQEISGDQAISAQQAAEGWLADNGYRAG